MGEIAEMMEEGILCQVCGEHLEDSAGEFFQTCPDCKEDCE